MYILLNIIIIIKIISLFKFSLPPGPGARSKNISGAGACACAAYTIKTLYSFLPASCTSLYYCLYHGSTLHAREGSTATVAAHIVAATARVYGNFG